MSIWTEHSESRTARTVVVLTLACVAGMVNATGFFAVGTYTSHVTGHASMIGDELARGDRVAALHYFVLVLFFVAGAFLATLFVESARRLGRARYVAALLVEASILTAFTAISALVEEKGEHLWRLLTAMLSISMGMQNALVTRISGAVVRTTHLTGVATDIGIELARLFYWLRRRTLAVSPFRLLVDFTREEELQKLRLHLALFASFLAGAVVGPLLFLRLGYAAMLAPGMLLFGLVLLDRFGWNRALSSGFGQDPAPMRGPPVS